MKHGPWRHTARAALVVACLLCTSSAHAGSSEYDHALALFNDLDYEGALDTLHNADLSGKQSPSQRAAVLALRAAILVELGQSKQASQLFAEALALHPKLTLKFKASRKAVALFQAQQSRRAPAVTAAPPPRSRARTRPPVEKREAAAVLPVATVSEPVAPMHAATASPVDAVRPNLDLRPVTTPAPASVLTSDTVVPSKPRRVSLLSKLLGIAAGGTAIAGGVFAVRVTMENKAANAATFQDEAMRHQASARAQAPIANTLLATGAALAVTAVVHHLLFDNR